MSKNPNQELMGAISKRVRSIIGDYSISSLQIDENGSAIIVIAVDPEHGFELEGMRQQVEKEVMKTSGISKVSAILTAERPSGAGSSRAQKNRGGDPHGMAENPTLDLPVKHVIVVASGKGGVGKSTVAANLAASLANTHGKKVGLLDADIYGPSLPLMMGSEEYKPPLNEDKKLIPADKHGVKVMSIGFLVDASKALVWRGPMAQNAFYQMLRDVEWAKDGEELDYLVIDLPPGTGDVQITLAQKVSVSGAVIVSTPQDMALIDARRAVEMFQKMEVPILGLVENMSTYICPNCDHEDHIFGNGGAREAAQEMGMPFLGDLPLAKDVRTYSDEGTPIVLAIPDGIAAQRINDITKVIVGALE